MVHCKNLRVVLTLLWVISVACSGGFYNSQCIVLLSGPDNRISCHLSEQTEQNFLLFIRTDDGSFTLAT